MTDEDQVKTEYYEAVSEDDIVTAYAGTRDEDDIVTEYAGESSKQGRTERKDAASLNRCWHCFSEFRGERTVICPVCGCVQSGVPKVNSHLYPGTVLKNHIVIGEVEGFGGFGVTYRAWDTTLRAMVAVKEYFNNKIVRRTPGEVLVQIQPGKEKQYRLEMNRFLQEARCTAQFRSCDNIVYVYDIFEENNTAYMVMQFLDGQTLQKAIKQNGGGLPWQKAVDIAVKVADAAAHLHRKSVIHRDISPDNIFLCKDGAVKLVDLGAAKFPEGDSFEPSIVKPGFAPPEQYSGEGAIGPWSDVYALAATLHYAISGQHPQESTSRLDNDEMEKPSFYDPEVPGYLDKTVMRGMDTDSRLRFQSMEEFASALQNKGKVIDSKTLVKKRKARRAVAITAALIAIAAGGVFLFSRFREIRDKALLTETTIEILVPGAADREEIYKEMTEEFLEQYPQVEVHITGVPDSEYEQKVSDELESGEGLTLYKNFVRQQDSADGRADLLELISELDPGQYIFLNQDREYRDIPLGFKAIAAYGNPTLPESSGVTLSKEDFLAGKAGIYIGDTTDFSDVQSRLPGAYSVLDLPDGKEAFCLTEEWCVNEKASEEQKNAAERLLSYWLGENAQDILHVRNATALPVNRSELEVYAAVNEEMSGIAGTVSGAPVSRSVFEERQKALANDADSIAFLKKQLTQ